MTHVVTSWIFWIGTLLSFVFLINQIIWTSANAEKRKQAAPKLAWAVIAFFVVFSIGGIIAILNQTLFNTSATPHL